MYQCRNTLHGCGVPMRALRLHRAPRVLLYGHRCRWISCLRPSSPFRMVRHKHVNKTVIEKVINMPRNAADLYMNDLLFWLMYNPSLQNLMTREVIKEGMPNNNALISLSWGYQNLIYTHPYHCCTPGESSWVRKACTKEGPRPRDMRARLRGSEALHKLPMLIRPLKIDAYKWR